MQGAVVVCYDDDGELSFHVYGDESVRLFIVDERAPGDRVYEWIRREDPSALKAMIGDSPIGSSADERHEAIKGVVEAALDGKKHLKLVE